MRTNNRKESSPNRDLFDDDQDSQGAWIVTFADLLALVITFFVLLYSMSTVVQSDWLEVSKSLSQRLKPNYNVSLTTTSTDFSVKRMWVDEGTNLQYLSAIIANKISVMTKLKKYVDVALYNDKVVISLHGKVLFRQGSQKLVGSANRLVILIGQALSTVQNSVEIISYAPLSPPENQGSPLNWELSLNRAITVLNVLRKGGYPYRMSALGRAVGGRMGGSDNLLEKRQENQQRIDIVVRKERAVF